MIISLQTASPALSLSWLPAVDVVARLLDVTARYFAMPLPEKKHGRP
ncbi:hypothetical protein [Bordetella genomosp. 13]|nr:hypothetical protein [Bordetella genomosp. 13]